MVEYSLTCQLPQRTVGSDRADSKISCNMPDWTDAITGFEIAPFDLCADAVFDVLIACSHG